MVAVDSSTIIAFVQGDGGPDVINFDAHLAAEDAIIPPVVLSEILSDPGLPPQHRALALRMATMEIHEGFWIRAAATRAAVLRRGLRARLPDALIAQSCIDHDLPLITRDGDFRHFAKHCGLKLA